MQPHPGFPPGRAGRALGAAKALLEVTRLTGALLAAQRLAHRGAYVRVVNYHATPLRDRERLRAHLAFFCDRFSPVSHDDLGRFLEKGRWDLPKPGLIVSFDDGLRSNFDVAAPLLEEFGFRGWFFAPTGFVSCPPEAQADFARRARIAVAEEDLSAGRIAMTWEELRDLAARGHVVGCHTQAHVRLGAELGAARLEEEIVGGKAELERRLDRPVDAFCWVGGEESSYSAGAAAWVRRAGFRFAFMTLHAPVVRGTSPLQIQRTNVEAGWPVGWAAFQVCGLLDLLYTRKRGRVVRLTAG